MEIEVNGVKYKIEFCYDEIPYDTRVQNVIICLLRRGVETYAGAAVQGPHDVYDEILAQRVAFKRAVLAMIRADNPLNHRRCERRHLSMFRAARHKAIMSVSAAQQNSPA